MVKGNLKGSIVVYYHNIDGPKIGIHYKRKCDSCERVYSFGYFQTKDKALVKEKVDPNSYYQISSCTLFHPNVFGEYEEWACEDGIGWESFSSKYNHRFKDQIDMLQKTLAKNNQTLGNRKNTDVSLNSTRLKEGFEMYKLQTMIEQDLKQSLIFSKDDFQLLEQNQTLLQNLGIKKSGIFQFVK